MSGDPLVRFRPDPGTADREVTLTEVLDACWGNVQGMIVQRTADIWKVLDPGNLGDVLNSGGPGGDNFWAPASGYLAPAFTSFAISGQASVIEVGTTIGGGPVTFTWSTSNSANVTPNSITIADTTLSTVLASGLANDGSEVITIGSIVNNSPAGHVWTIGGLNTHSGTFNRTFTVQWEWRVYAGVNAATVLTANQIKALSASNALQSSFAGTYSPTSVTLTYYYFAYPDSMGDATSFVDGNTGFPISMASVSDDSAYSNTDGTWFWDIVSVTNAQGVATDYRLYRTQNNFSGTLKMVIS